MERTGIILNNITLRKSVCLSVPHLRPNYITNLDEIEAIENLGEHKDFFLIVFKKYTPNGFK